MTKVTRANATTLATIAYLGGLPAAELDALGQRCAVRVVRKGASVFREGAPADGLFVIIAGRVNLVRASPSGREQVLHTEGPGATLGEVPVLDGGGYLASAVAAEDARVLFVPAPALREICRRRPEVAEGIIRVLAQRLRKFAGLIESLSLQDVTARVAGFLADEVHRQRTPDLRIPLTRDEIAARVGTVREPVSRALARLKAEQVVAVSPRRVQVLDLERLRRIAGVR